MVNVSLTKSQKKAVQTLGKNILVSAGAGTGKTRVLVERILHLLLDQKALITELLVMTFTEKAALEIKSRLSASLRAAGLDRACQELERAAISTFHSFASRLLKEHPIEAGVDPDFRVIESEQAELLKEEVLRETIAACYAENREAFELLPVYGEDKVRDGILRVYTAARHEGKTLLEFFEESAARRKKVCSDREEALAAEACALIPKLEGVDPEVWRRFLDQKVWDRATALDFDGWSAHAKGKRKAGWKEWRTVLEDLAAIRAEAGVAPWRQKFESLALAFEAGYGARKAEEGFLDFDDLQMKAVSLFRGRTPALERLRERYQRQFKFILVDEFQDTNFLQMEFVELLASQGNLFLVGDYKQSIYGFRGAEPRLFRDKERAYEDGVAGERIFLSESFRSEPPVLDFVNRFFKMLWEEDRFPFDPLVPKSGAGASFGTAPARSGGAAVEVLVTGQKDGEDMRCSRLREARAIAARVRELHDKEKIPYGDMAVLFQAMTSSGLYEDAFKSAGVPYFIVAGRGFYEQAEIQDMMSFLSHLDKPLADIPLAATLRSPFFHITDDTLFWLARAAKAKNDETPLCRAFDRLDALEEITADQKERLKAFLALTRELSALKDRIPLSELIDTILDRTGYELSVLMDPRGVRRYANLKKLIAMVREYETYDRMSLGAFLKILQRLKAQDVRESEAQVVQETSAEAVRMMSVHAAKGLEFSVVFVADMGHSGSRSDSKTVIAHAADGYAMQAPAEAGEDPVKPYFFRWVDREIAAREDEEWKRLFYVAVTRAKARLFLSGVHKKKKEEKKTFREMSSWMDWVMTICDNGASRPRERAGGSETPAGEAMSIPMTVDPEPVGKPHGGAKADIRDKVAVLIKDVMKEENPQPVVEAQAPGAPAPRSIDLPVSAYVLFQKDPQAFWRTYQLGWGAGASEWSGEESSFEKEDFSAADFGTVMHGFLEYLDFDAPEPGWESGAVDRAFSRFGADAVAEARKLVEDLLKQPVFGSLRKAKQVQREVDFVLNERRGLIHGKIDVLFEDAQGGWHILDYKTASGDETSAKRSGYDLQMELYALAAQRILKLPVRSAIIYYLKNQKAVTLSFPDAGGDAFFDGLEKKICVLQQQILDYSNERMAQPAK